MLRRALFGLVVASIFGLNAGIAQESSSNPEARKPAASAPGGQPASGEVVAAETAIAASDWKGAEAKLAPYLVTHPDDARALFDAGYVADAEKRLEEAAGFYRRAMAANPKSFEAHVELGLLLARQGKPEEARLELAAATALDAGPPERGQGAGWRALAEIDGSPAGRRYRRGDQGFA